MKNVLSLLTILMILGAFAPGAQAQPDDPCQAEAVVAAFAEAVAAGEVDAWMETLPESACPPAVINGALSLVVAYTAMQEATAGAASGPLPDELPVVSYTDSHGIETRIDVAHVTHWDADRCMAVADGQTTLGLAPGVFVTAGLETIVQAVQNGDRMLVYYADAQVFEGTAGFVLEDATGKAFPAADAIAISVISLPRSGANLGFEGLDPEQPVWELNIPSARMAFRGADPRFTYRAATCETPGPDGSPLATGRGFTFAPGPQSLDVTLNDLAAIQVDGASITPTTSDGQAMSGPFALEDAGERWYFVLTLGYGREVWVASGTPFSLGRVTG